jgi:hypothetical protein
MSTYKHLTTVTHNGHTYNMGDEVIILSYKGHDSVDKGKIVVIDDEGFDIGDPDGEVRVKEISDTELYFHWLMLDDIAPAIPNELMFRDWKGG